VDEISKGNVLNENDNILINIYRSSKQYLNVSKIDDFTVKFPSPVVCILTHALHLCPFHIRDTVSAIKQMEVNVRIRENCGFKVAAKELVYHGFLLLCFLMYVSPARLNRTIVFVNPNNLQSYNIILTNKLVRDLATAAYYYYLSI
jgi:hypothetical protein